MGFQFARIQGASLQASSRKFFLDVRRLTDKHRPKRAAEDQKLLTKIMDLIRSEPDVSQWEIRSHSEFIELVYDLLSSELTATQANELFAPAHVRDFQSKADWLLNLALAGTDDSAAPAKLSACGFWARSRLLDSLDNLGGLPEAIMAVLGDSSN
jgi:hypothetical protein